jgi:hypothetical protein
VPQPQEPAPPSSTEARAYTAVRDRQDVEMKTILARHARLADGFAAEAERHERQSLRLSWLRLGTFLAAVVVLASAWSERSVALMGWGLLALLGFFAAVIAHGRTVNAQ